MEKNNRSHAIIASAISLLIALGVASASAQEADAVSAAQQKIVHDMVDEIIVSATGIPTPASQIGVSMNVITGDDISREQIRLLPNIFAKLPSVNFNQEGGMGGVGYLRVRGLDRQYTAIFVDGVSLNDPSDINSSAELANFLTTDIERVEVIRGSQSILHGSNAIAGVINIYTQKGQGPMAVKLNTELGTNAYQSANLTVSGGAMEDRLGYRISTSYLASEPDSELDYRDGVNRQDEDYETRAISGRVDYAVSDVWETSLNFRSGASSAETDGYNPTTFAPQDGWFGNDAQETSLRLELRGDHQQSRVTTLIAANYFSRTRDSFQEMGDYYWYDGERTGYEARVAFDINPSTKILVGGETKDESFSQAGLSEKQVETSSIYVMGQTSLRDRLHLSLGVRNDDHDKFGSFDTWRSSAAFTVNPALRLRATYGTGFRAPSLYELFGEDPYCIDGLCGNINLQPEESASFDIGADFAVLSGDLKLGLTYFDIETENQIYYRSDPVTYAGNYQNDTGSASSSGYEFTLNYAVSDALSASANVTLTDPRKADGTVRDKQARQMFNLGLDYRFADNRASVGASWRDVSKLYVYGARVENYALLSLRGSWQFRNNLRGTLRVENALDEDYQTSTNKSTPGRSVFVGLEAKF